MIYSLNPHLLIILFTKICTHFLHYQQLSFSRYNWPLWTNKRKVELSQQKFWSLDYFSFCLVVLPIYRPQKYLKQLHLSWLCFHSSAVNRKKTNVVEANREKKSWTVNSIDRVGYWQDRLFLLRTIGSELGIKPLQKSVVCQFFSHYSNVIFRNANLKIVNDLTTGLKLSIFFIVSWLRLLM